jgi:predicted deacylase
LEPGPVLLLLGGMHGDEINGIEIVRRIIDSNQHKVLRGTTICIPLMNIYGFIHFSRTLPDGKDVNRSFPGNKNGSLASRMADYLVKDIIPKIDFGIDFHTGGAQRTNYPQTRCVMKDKENQILAAAFNAPFALNSNFRPNSLRWTASKMGKKILVYEGGESVRFDEFAINEGINGTLRVMKHLNMIDEAPLANHICKEVTNSSWIRSDKAGLFNSLVQSGEYIKKNQIVGQLTDPFGEFKKHVKTKVEGFVIGLNNNPLLHQGDAIMHIGVV